MAKATINVEQDARIAELEAQIAELTEALASVRERVHDHANHLQHLLTAPKVSSKIDDLAPVV